MIGLEAITAARRIIAGRLHRTPVVSCRSLGDETGLDLILKLEMFQKTGSFKPRGVLNKLHHLTSDERERGVITLSSGNHAAALAYAASQSGINSTVVMPSWSTPDKVEATRRYGAEVILTDEDLLDTCLRVQSERSLTLVHPFDDPMTIAGAGTLGLEILEDVPDVDSVIVGVGGGGLISGVATAIKLTKANVNVVGVEPHGASAMTQSLRLGRPVHLDSVNTVADGLAAPFAGEHTLAHVQRYVDEMVLVSDDEILDAMGLILERCKVIAEPAASSTLAALLHRKTNIPPGSKVVCLLSGGNIDRERLKSLL